MHLVRSGPNTDPDTRRGRCAYARSSSRARGRARTARARSRPRRAPRAPTRQRTPSRPRRRPRRVSWADHAVAEHADAGEFELDDVAGDVRPVAHRAGGDDVAGIQPRAATGVLDE